MESPPSLQCSYDMGAEVEWTQKQTEESDRAARRGASSAGDEPVREEALRELARLRQSLMEACAAHMTRQEQLIAGVADRLERCSRPRVPARVESKASATPSNTLDEDESVEEGDRAKVPFSEPPTQITTATGSGQCCGQLVSADPQVAHEGSGPRRLLNHILDARAWKSFKPSTTTSSLNLSVLRGLSQRDQEDQHEVRRIRTQRSNVGHVVSVLTPADSRLGEWVTESLKEPPRDGVLAHFVDGHLFHVLTVIIIMLNGCYTFWQTNTGMTEAQSGQEVTALLEVEVTFLVIFAVELALKIAVHRIFFFVGADHFWNWFDSVVVFVSAVDLVVTYFDVFKGMNLTFLRICRLFKMSKVARIFRAFRFFTELRLLLKCLMNCFSALFWSGVMLVFVKFLFGLYFVQALTTFVEEEMRSGDGISSEKLSQVLDAFGSVQAAMVSLLKATTGGESWSTYYDIVSMTGIFSQILFLFYIVFFIIAVWNIVTSVFVEKIMVLAGPTVEEAAFERRKRMTEDAVDLLDMAQELDKDGSGQISLEEFVSGMENKTCRSYFAVRGIDVKDGVTFFNMLATVTGGLKVVPLDVFVHGCLRLRGPASSIDLHTFNYEFKLMHRNVDKFQTYCSDQFRAQTLQLGVLREELRQMRGTSGPSDPR